MGWSTNSSQGSILLTSIRNYPGLPRPTVRDLLIQTRRSLVVVEIKRRKDIGREVIDEVDEKIRAIERPEGVSIRTALVYDGHLSPVVAADGYFDAIIPFKNLLE